MMNIRIFPYTQQGVGAFDGGKFVEQRPISFPGEKAAVDRVGSLFYWAWGKSTDVAEIGMHPHKAFEIVTYVIEGLVEHRDSLGSLETVSRGGAQVIQAGSGISHSEAFRTVGSEGLQIWFEPNLNVTVKQPATYKQYNHEQFPSSLEGPTTVKTVIGGGAPIRLDTEVSMFDWTLQPGTEFSYKLQSSRLLALLVIRGQGTSTAADSTHALAHKDFAVVEASQEVEFLRLQADNEEGIRIIAIEVPKDPGYVLYSK
ncbi:pirin [Paenibacillus sp. SYP-B3998]|uniref:Pirin n=1 Tax=Paenibacillus sp. SYP-B3998 TaxID=2678564 RepID=A0A6G4A120_9BACL|nr:pirin family protein [Paenibacillus sp. SYP-B3998]NEW07519.1 pirin [Paenibacillus sp. SYP-B3998]